MPHLAKLANWLVGWVNDDGAVHGFHNHSMWGGNPYRWTDHYAGHTTWASPLMAALGCALRETPDAAGLELLQRMIRYQTGSFQPDDQYDHIGFETGELSKRALIHNAITNVSLLLTAEHGRDFLPEDLLERIRRAVLRNDGALAIFGGGHPGPDGTCNQEYARIWYRLLFERVFGDRRWHDAVKQDIDYMIGRFHVDGIPDAECEATIRHQKDHDTLEPTEYYGLIVAPLLLASDIYGEADYRRRAGRICLHAARSSWRDTLGAARFNRIWYRRFEGNWRRNDAPMLIAGMGFTLYGIDRYLRGSCGGAADEELERFLDDCEATYRTYQHPRGFFVSATGWHTEADIAPSTAWHSHDLLYLVNRRGIPATFWEQLRAADETTAVLLGTTCFWIERGKHWGIADYFWMDVYQLFGRKDEAAFGRNLSWVNHPKALPARLFMRDIPVLFKEGDKVYLREGDGAGLSVMALAPLEYRGPMEDTE